MSQSRSTSRSTAADQYDVRLFEPADRERYVALFDRVLSGADTDWFEWKYEDNPFADHVPIVVATDDDRLVGAKSAVAVRLRAGNETIDALQPADTMVHPDHRRRGLFSRMTEFMKAHYAPRSPELFFNFPNEKTLAGGRKHGWQEVGRLPTYYRIQRVSAMAGDQLSGPVERGFDLFDPFLDAYLTARTELVSLRPDVRVIERDGVPADILADLYRRSVPDAIHAERSEQFYQWRFENPKWTYRTYLAGRSGPDVGVVTGSGVRDGTEMVNIVDVVPLVGTDRREALKAALTEVCLRNDDADVIAFSGQVIPEDLLSSLGFLADTEFPLSSVSSPNAFVSYPLTDDGSWTVAGRDVRNLDNWLVTFAEQDTR